MAKIKMANNLSLDSFLKKGLRSEVHGRTLKENINLLLKCETPQGISGSQGWMVMSSVPGPWSSGHFTSNLCIILSGNLITGFKYFDRIRFSSSVLKTFNRNSTRGDRSRAISQLYFIDSKGPRLYQR